MTIIIIIMGRANENNDFLIYVLDFAAQTDHVIKARRFDMIVADKESNLCETNDFTMPFHSMVSAKEVDKLTNIEV